MIAMRDVLDQWNRPDAESYAHPTWDEAADNGGDRYWESGWEQSQDVAQYATPGSRVIDFGAGNGRLTIPLAKLGFDVYAVDASPNMLDRIKTNTAEQGVHATRINSDGSDLAKQMGRKRADVIVARGVLIHHDHDSVLEIVTNLVKAMKKGGYLIADWPTGMPQVRDTWIGVTVWDPVHRAQVAEQAGLEPVIVGTEPSVWRKT